MEIKSLIKKVFCSGNSFTKPIALIIINFNRAENNSWSTDSVWPDHGHDRSNSHIAGHFWI